VPRVPQDHSFKEKKAEEEEEEEEENPQESLKDFQLISRSKCLQKSSRDAPEFCKDPARILPVS